MKHAKTKTGTADRAGANGANPKPKRTAAAKGARKKASAKFAGLTGVSKAHADALTAKGLTTAEAIANARPADIADIDGADKVRQKAREAVMKAQGGGKRP